MAAAAAKTRAGGRAVRPKGLGPQPAKISLAVSRKLKGVVVRLKELIGGTEADVIREALRLLAEAHGLPRPPLR